VTVTQDQVWQINRPIELTFSQAVDPLSVSQTTVQVREVSGGPVVGTFFVRASAPRTVVFQPRCPTLPDLSDAGFLLSDQAQGIVRTYQLIVSANGGGTGSTVQSTGGSGLENGLALTFTTPDQADPPAVVFYDTKVGPPAPLIRGVGGGGTGGPGGNFDFQIPDGDIFTFDTTSQTITGGPNFIPTTQVTAVGGVLDLRNFRVGEGSRLKFSGPNPVTILASGKVEILGLITVEGNDSMGVNTLNTTNIPEPGAPGQAGGGKGGVGSPLTSASSPSGGTGYGAFNVPDGGGQGGETGWNDVINTATARRGGGGGGGRMGHDQLVDHGGTMGWDVDESFIGLNIEKGFRGGNNAFGAKNPTAKIQPPEGGEPGPSPFLGLNDENDFWGTMHDPVTLEITLGELDAPMPGAGGGGGGDSSYTNGQIFPHIPFLSTGDEKGAGGGGAGGAITMLVIGDITFGPDGRISARGGTGGGGEGGGGQARAGAGSGGGSGGHLILQTASTIDLSESLAGTGKPVKKPALFATGGQGGPESTTRAARPSAPRGARRPRPTMMPATTPPWAARAPSPVREATGGRGSSSSTRLPARRGSSLPPARPCSTSASRPRWGPARPTCCRSSAAPPSRARYGFPWARAGTT